MCANGASCCKLKFTVYSLYIGKLPSLGAKAVDLSCLGLIVA